jgi:hypothetical protein
MRFTNKFRLLIGVVVIILLIIVITSCEEDNKRQYTLEDNKQIATLFILNSPTYSSSGTKLQLIETKTVVECSSCYEFKFEFIASGYGSKNVMVDPIKEKYFAYILVEEGEVARAIVNDKWDELEQEMVR